VLNLQIVAKTESLKWPTLITARWFPCLAWLQSYKGLSAQECAALSAAAILNPMGLMCESQGRDDDDEEAASTVARFNIAPRSSTGHANASVFSQCRRLLK